MRIRKNAKLSPLFFSSHASAPEVLQAHVCQLNQSPWDVIPFAASQSHQTDCEDNFTINVSLGDSINGVVDSVESMMDMVEDKEDGEIGVKNDNMLIFDEDDNNETKTCFGGNGIESSKGKKRLCCQKKDGKGWQCKKEAEEGLSFCEHHISLIRSYNNNNISTTTSFSSQNDVSSKKAQTSAGARRTRATSSRTNKGSSSNPNEFYYYSGFGPLWGRRRGERGVCGDGNKSEAAKYDDDDNENTVSSENTQSAQTTPQSFSSPIDNEEFDYVDDDDDDDDDEVSGDSGRKRMRKPVKARSLKSLM